MNDAREHDLFALRQRRQNPVPLTQKEAAFLRLAHAYGISDLAAAKTILLLRAKKQTPTSKSKDVIS